MEMVEVPSGDKRGVRDVCVYSDVEEPGAGDEASTRRRVCMRRGSGFGQRDGKSFTITERSLQIVVTRFARISYFLLFAFWGAGG